MPFQAIDDSNFCLEKFERSCAENISYSS